MTWVVWFVASFITGWLSHRYGLSAMEYAICATPFMVAIVIADVIERRREIRARRRAHLTD